MQYARGPFYISFMLFIITVVKLLIIWSWDFAYSVHRYLGFLKCVALLNRVAENILISITIATYKSFSREIIPPPHFHVTKHKYPFIILEKQIHSQERVASLGALAGLSPGVLPPTQVELSGASITHYGIICPDDVQEWTVPSSGINILIFLNNAKWFWKKKDISMHQEKIVTDRDNWRTSEILN